MGDWDAIKLCSPDPGRCLRNVKPLADMNTANPNAVALGKLGRGRPKTLSAAAMAQRKAASSGGVKARKLAIKARMKNANKNQNVGTSSTKNQASTNTASTT